MDSYLHNIKNQLARPEKTVAMTSSLYLNAYLKEMNHTPYEFQLFQRCVNTALTVPNRNVNLNQIAPPKQKCDFATFSDNAYAARNHNTDRNTLTKLKNEDFILKTAHFVAVLLSSI